MDPTHERSLESLPARKLPHLLQNRAHYALATYLNGTNDVNLDRLEAVDTRVGADLSGDGLRERLLAAYRWLASDLPVGTRTQEVNIGEFDPARYDANELEAAILAIAANLETVEDLLVSAVLHGSFGDLTYVQNYSDVDLLLVVKWETLADPDAVQRLREAIRLVQREAYYVDPHQHHGVMVVTDLDLRAYNRAYLPLEVFAAGTVLAGNSSLTFSVRDDELERQYGFWRSVQRLRKTVADERFPVGFDGQGQLLSDLSGHLYSFKYFTSFVMVQPSMYLLADGRPAYKADSFDALPDFPDTGNILDECSEIRRAYPAHVSFDRSESYRRRLAEDPLAARADQQSTIPQALQQELDGRPFVRALELVEQLWTQVT
jgi:hypothetical protein